MKKNTPSKAPVKKVSHYWGLFTKQGRLTSFNESREPLRQLRKDIDPDSSKTLTPSKFRVIKVK